MPPVHRGEIPGEHFPKPVHLTVIKLAAELHAPATRVGEIVHRRRRIAAETALRLARSLHNDPGWGATCRTSTTSKFRAAPAKTPRSSGKSRCRPYLLSRDIRRFPIEDCPRFWHGEGLVRLRRRSPKKTEGATAVKLSRPLNRAVSLQAFRVNQATNRLAAIASSKLMPTTCELFNSAHRSQKP
jgi:addiction module HigA family antidote